MNLTAKSPPHSTANQIPATASATGHHLAARSLQNCTALRAGPPRNFSTYADHDLARPTRTRRQPEPAPARKEQPRNEPPAIDKQRTARLRRITETPTAKAAEPAPLPEPRDEEQVTDEPVALTVYTFGLDPELHTNYDESCAFRRPRHDALSFRNKRQLCRGIMATGTTIMAALHEGHIPDIKAAVVQMQVIAAEMLRQSGYPVAITFDDGDPFADWIDPERDLFKAVKSAVIKELTT